MLYEVITMDSKLPKDILDLVNQREQEIKDGLFRVT